MRRALAGIAVGVVCLAATASSRQAPTQQPTVPRFRSGVELVTLDVSVLDRNRMPVRGLKAADFTILEGGRPQDVASFAAIDLPDIETRKVSAAWLRDVAPDVQSNEVAFGEHGIFVIVFDDSTPMPAEDVPSAKEWARLFVTQLGPGAVAAVVYTFNRADGQEFTQDRARLLSAIDRFNGAIDLDLPFDRFDINASTLYRATVGTLCDVVEHLAGLPGRKAVVFVSVGVPLDIGLNAPALIGTLEGSSVGASDVVQALVGDLNQTLRAAQRNNVNVYGLDPGGLRPPASVRSLRTGSGRLEPSPGLLNREFLQTVSDSTGGFAVTNTNDAGPGMTQIIRENASYYLLGYYPDNPRAEGKQRRIEVKVNRPGVKVRTRSGYREPDGRKAEPARDTSDRPATPLDKAMFGPIASGGISLRASAAPFAVADGRKAGVAIVLGVREPRSNDSAPVEDVLDVLVRAYDVRGRNVASDRVSGRVSVRPDFAREAVYEFLSRIDLKPGRYHLRVAAESPLRGESGSVYCDVDVPDFSGQRVSMSGVTISQTPGLTSEPKGRIASLVPVVPTTTREFGPDDKAAAFFRVYQGGSAPLAQVGLVTTVRNADNAVVFKGSEKLTPARFSNDRSADVRFTLPLHTLTPGPHLLTFEATLGKRTVRRQVRFTVR